MQANLQRPLDVVVLDGAEFYQGNISGTEKANTIKKQLAIPIDEPFMEALGRQYKAAMVRETHDEWELILPHNLLSLSSLQEWQVARFQRHKVLPVTVKWQCQGQPWQVWDDNSPPAVPNLSLDWMAL